MSLVTTPMINLMTEAERNQARDRWCREPLTEVGKTVKLLLDSLEFSIGQRDSLNKLLAGANLELEEIVRKQIGLPIHASDRLPVVEEGQTYSDDVHIFYSGSWVAAAFDRRFEAWRLHIGPVESMVEVCNAPWWKPQPPAPPTEE